LAVKKLAFNKEQQKQLLFKMTLKNLKRISKLPKKLLQAALDPLAL
jgi:hypothetical protein